MMEKDWLVGRFGFYGSLKQYFGLCQAVSQKNYSNNPYLHLLQAQWALALVYPN